MLKADDDKAREAEAKKQQAARGRHDRYNLSEKEFWAGRADFGQGYTTVIFVTELFIHCRI